MFLFTILEHLTPLFLICGNPKLEQGFGSCCFFFMKMYAVKFKLTSEGRGVGHKSSTTNKVTRSSGLEVIKLFPCST